MRIKFGLGIAILSLTAAAGINAAAQDNIEVNINGDEVVFDQSPVIINGRTLVPIRAVAEKMGLKVLWNGERSTVEVISPDTNIMLTVNDSAMCLNESDTVTLDEPPRIIGNRTYLPIRAVCEVFGAEVSWDGENREINIDAPEDIYLLTLNGYGGTEQLSVYYNDNIFDESSHEHNPQLAEISAAAVTCSQDDSAVNELYEKLGFNAPKRYNFENTDDIHKSNYYITSKKYNGKNIVSVIVCGTDGNEWYSNFDVYGPDKKTQSKHYGFATAADKLCEDIEAYAQERGIEFDSLWLCGHSRGAAVSCIAAHELKNKFENIFCYTFATPNVSTELGEQDDYIFNYVCYDDVVTLIPLSEQDWGYGRYGRDIDVTESDALFETEFKRVTGIPYLGINHQNVKSLTDELYKLAPSVKAYYNTQYTDYTPYEYFSHVIGGFMAEGELADGIRTAFEGEFMPITRFFAMNNITQLHISEGYYARTHIYNLNNRSK